MLLSKKHGLNPSLSVCFFCGKTKNELILMGALRGDEEAPRQAVFNREPCEECKSLMNQGIMLVSVKDGETDTKNPYRTGSICVIKEEAARRIFNTEEVFKTRFAWIHDSVWDKIGLPRNVKVGGNYDQL